MALLQPEPEARTQQSRGAAGSHLTEARIPGGSWQDQQRATGGMVRFPAEEIVDRINFHRLLVGSSTEVVPEDNNARWGNQICNYRKGIQFSGVEHVGNKE